MAKDSTITAIAKVNYELLCNAETLLSLVCVLPLLKLVQGLSKFTQGRLTFICDFVVAFKLCETNLQEMYCEPNTKFSPKHFSLFLELFELINSKLCLTWWKELAS
jgi:hypothetical protein